MSSVRSRVSALSLIQVTVFRVALTGGLSRSQPFLGTAHCFVGFLYCFCFQSYVVLATCLAQLGLLFFLDF